MISKARTVPAFLAELPVDRRRALTQLRAMIRKAAPKAVGSMRYGMPCYDAASGEPLVGMNAQKHYFALYFDPVVMATHKAALKGLDCGKCSIRFKRLDQLPLGAIEKLLRDTARRAAKRSPAPKAARARS